MKKVGPRSADAIKFLMYVKKPTRKLTRKINRARKNEKTHQYYSKGNMLRFREVAEYILLMSEVLTEKENIFVNGYGEMQIKI